MTHIAGGAYAGQLGDGGLAVNAFLNNAHDIVIDRGGNLFVADGWGSRVRRVDASTGIITTYAGTGSLTYSGENGLATAAGVPAPEALAFDATGNFYIADSFNAANDRIRKVSIHDGKITRVAGSSSGFSGDGGAATAAKVNGPLGIVVDGRGALYVADTGN